MPIILRGTAKAKRAALVRKWSAQGDTQATIQEKCKAKYGFGIHSNTVKAILAEGKPEPPSTETKPETALVLTSSSGLVPAREVSPRLRAMVAKVADLMIEDGVLTITIDGREVILSYTPEEQVFEV